MASEQILVTSPATRSEKTSTIAKKSWEFIREAPTIPVLILAFVFFVASLASVMRMITWSQKPPKYPETIPTVTPIAPAKTVPSNPIIREVRAPQINRLRMSRP